MMKRFSERLGFKEAPRLLQTEDMSATLRNSLWNFTISLFDNNRGDWLAGAKAIAQFFRRSPVDELPDYDSQCREWIKQYFFRLQWCEVYDLIEFICSNYERLFTARRIRRPEQLHEICNHILENEMSGYRFVAGVLMPISSPAETAEVASAVEATSRYGLTGAHAHITTALALFGKRPDPDYRNCIKEAISAVESIAKQLGESGAQGLAGALTDLSEKVPIHGALRSAFIKLYGYTSDEDGIRHAILEEPTVGFDEAKYMIVSCSAFVNYLAAKAQAAGKLAQDVN